MTKNQVIVLISVLLSVAAALGATLLILKYLKKKKEKAIAPANLAFENDFSDDFDFVTE